MHLTLLAADLFPPPAFVPAQAIPRLPALEWLLAKGDTSKVPGCFLEEALQAETGSTGPVAPLTLLADGGAPGNQTWLRADPVHLSVQRDNVQLLDSHLIAPTLDEARAITATLNAHFAADGLKIEAPHDARWYLQIPPQEIPLAAPLWRMNGASVFERLPAHSGRINWRALQNETAMLLHDHPVNQAREATGRLTINGLWFWGGGALAPAPKRATTHMVANLALARGIALHAGDTPTALPDSAAGLPAAGDTTLVVLHQATRALRASDAAGWLAAVENLHTNWFAPAAEMLRAGRLSELSLILPNESTTVSSRILPGMRRRFWRGVKPWATYFPAHA